MKKSDIIPDTLIGEAHQCPQMASEESAISVTFCEQGGEGRKWNVTA